MKRKTLFLVLLIYFVGLFFRLYQLNQTSVYPDEITWMVKGKEAVYALTKLNFDYFRYHAWWNSTTDAYAISWPLAILNGVFHIVFAGVGKFSMHLFSDIYASRLPLVLIGPLTAVYLYLFAKNYLKNSYSLLIALAYTLNPITIALDRWILNDSYLALFTFLSLTIYITAFKKEKLSVIPGLFVALSFLTKPQGIIPLVGFLALTLIKPSKFGRKLFVLNCLSFFVSTSLLWPQSWIDPFLAIPKYLFSQLNLAQIGDPIPNFFFGPTDNPHWLYYIFQILTRTPELVIIFFSIGFAFAFRALRRGQKIDLILLTPALTYCLLKLLIISIVSVKGGFRYGLSFLPWIYLAAGYGLEKVADKLSKEVKVVLFGFFLITTVVQLSYFPDYYLYYNQFIGGPKTAQKYDLVGLCIGSDEALKYLDQSRIEGLVGIIGCQDTGPYNTGRQLTKDWNSADILILESAYAQQYPFRQEVKNLEKRELIYTVIEDGIVTARIYR